MDLVRSAKWALVVGVSVGLTGCGKGPKGDCEGSLESWGKVINDNDWDAMVELIHPDQRKKFGDETIREFGYQIYKGARDYKWKKIQADVSGNICIARTIAYYNVKIRGKLPVDFDNQYVSYVLHEKDGLWYFDLPGSTKVGGY